MRFPWSRAQARVSVRPPRVYAVGDIHGRVDLFDQMIERIRNDVALRPSRATRIVLLGDFIDRGPDSAALIRIFMRLNKQRNVIVLKGNHEAVMADALDGDHGALDLWLEHGGTTTLASFGVNIEALDLDDTPVVLRAAQRAVPRSVHKWLKQLPTHIQFGDHYFVHAGIKPGVPLEEQTDADRLWIMDEFTASDAHHGAVIVHGHTIHPDGVHVSHNRIGVDTGAYLTNRLSAVAVDGDEHWIITV